MQRVNVVYCLCYDNMNDKLLMVHNKDVDVWSMPGGFIEEGETIEQAAVREFYEETGLHANVLGVAAVNECKFESKNEHVIFFTVRVDILGGKEEILFPEEISQIQWVDLALASKRMPYHQNGIEPLIKSLVKYTNQGVK